jgi:hypothetical protein
MQRTGIRRYLKPLGLMLIFILVVAGGLVLREYLMLRKLAKSLTGLSVTQETPVQNMKLDERGPSADAAPTPKIVLQVKHSTDGSQVTARVSFRAFKRLIELNPQIAHTWGRVGWKILGDTPALCLRQLTRNTPLTALGVQSGDCITHLDDETINQPLRNLGIWLGLGNRRYLSVETLRQGKRLSYKLTGD